MVYFTIYFVAHHFLGAFGTRWILYVGVAAVALYVFKANAWDYSDKFLNIMGRTTIPYMLFWGAGGLVFVKVVYPALSRLIEFTPKRIGNVIMPMFMVFVLLSHVVSYAALFRYGTRSEGQPASSGIEKVLDKYYDDSFTKQYYDNPVHEKKGSRAKAKDLLGCRRLCRPSFG